MNRRHFLRNGSLASLAVGSLTVASCNEVATEKKEPTKLTDDVFKDDFELNEVTIEVLQQKMQSGELTATSITKLYLDRIAAIDKSGPSLNAVIELNPDAIAIAEAMDKERKSGKVRGPMHGIPVLIKDNINTADKMMTTAGASALTGNIAATDAFIVQQLRSAGAVLLGKTNLSEWANFRSERSTSGWSSRGGQTKCPYRLDRNPSGSSAGTGSAVAANLCAVAIGTETNGSIISPSSVNGIVGIKPTVGLLSRTGIIPISATQDTAGPMARTVKDAAIFLAALAGVDEADAVTRNSMGKASKDYSASLATSTLSGKRIGVEQSFLHGHEGVVQLYKNAIETLKAQGAIIIETDLMKSINDIEGEYDVLLYEFKDGVNKYLSTATAPVKSIEEVMAFNKKNEATAMPFFKQEILEKSNAKGDLSSKEYTTALHNILQSRGIIDALLKEHQLDAIAAVSNGVACCIDLINGDYDTGFSFSTPAAIAGYPHITLPMGMVHDLPVGISFMAGAYQEQAIIDIAYVFEQATKHRTKPGFIAAASMG
ncbi:amidase [Limnovirga soli]|uniref:Amidase n=1 Tax=Limnovirga soli TaxID=2656915 RepID=A0A8J8FHE2_9BACT|nr:amidase [Limnovirga soli]NNV56647.1 amidase [Limnovirga soli]